MNLNKMYPTGLYVVAQIILLLLFLLPGIIFGFWRWAVTK